MGPAVGAPSDPGLIPGALTPCTTESGRRYTDTDRVLAEDLAQRAATAVDNARLYRDAVAADRAKSDFLAVMSHELRTPLDAILGDAGPLEAGIAGPLAEAQRGYVARGSDAARRLLALVEDLLTFAKLEAGRAAPAVLADPEPAAQVLLTLLTNAVEFTPADKHEAVFEPFVQLEAGHTRTTWGTGLWLAISRDLARGMGGDVTVASVLGARATFALVLPRVPDGDVARGRRRRLTGPGTRVCMTLAALRSGHDRGIMRARSAGVCCGTPVSAPRPCPLPMSSTPRSSGPIVPAPAPPEARAAGAPGEGRAGREAAGGPQGVPPANARPAVLRAALADPARLAALRATGAALPAPDPAFDRLTALAVRLLTVPAALVSLVAEDRQLFPGSIGLPPAWQRARQTPLSHSFCQYHLPGGDEFAVEDARVDPVLHDNLAVRDLDVVAYLGVPLRTSTGQVLGAFCVLDSRPRRWTAAERETVRALAHAATTELELRLTVAQREALLAAVPTPAMLLDTTWHVMHRNARAAADPLWGAVGPGQSLWAADPGLADSALAGCLRAAAAAAAAETAFEVADPRDAARTLAVRCVPAPGGLAVHFDDVTERRRAASAQQAAEARYRQLVEHSPEAVVVHRDGVVVYANARAAALVGEAHDRLVGEPLARWLDPASHARLDAALALARATRVAPPADAAAEYRIVCPDGSTRDVEARSVAVELDGRPAVQSVLRDVTARNQLESELARQALHCPLTGLANRTLFRDRVTHALARRRELQGEPPARITPPADGAREHLAVLAVDLDDFKAVNDTHGHAAGDQLLRTLAARLRTATREADTVGRMGGDEFAVLLEGLTGRQEAEQVAARVLAACATPVTIGGDPVRVGVSVGVAHAAGGDDVDALLHHADVALYHAKHAGKGRVAVFAPSMHAAAVARLAMARDLRDAVAHDELSLVYQPVVELATGTVRGVEALLRWTNAAHGAVPAHTFVTLAEETGLLRAIGRWVLGAACAQLARWDATRAAARDGAPGAPAAGAPPLQLAVNVSGRQLEDPGFPDDVAAALAASGIAPARLTLEVSESAVMRNGETALRRLAALKALGVTLAIDDFGTGYSSLPYLQRFPVDVLKIDKAVVDGVARGGDDAAVARTIVALGEALGLRTSAEGVEDEAQRAVLAALGCTEAQGYLFARPLPPDAIVPLLG